MALTVTWLPLGIAAVLSGITLAAILVLPYPPLQNYLEWAYQSWIVSEIMRGSPPPGVELVPYPVPNSLTQILLAGLYLIMDQAHAEIALVILYMGWSTALAIAIGRKFNFAISLIYIVTIAYNSTFWDGHINYAFGMLMFSSYFLLPVRFQKNKIAIGLIGLLLFFTHAIVFAVFSVVIILGNMSPRDRASSLALLPSFALFAWYWMENTGIENFGPAGYSSIVQYIMYKFYTLAKIGPYHNFVLERGGDAASNIYLYTAGSLVNFIYAMLLAYCLTSGLMRMKGHPHGDDAPRLDLWASLALLAGFLLMPPAMEGIVNPGERFLYPAILLLLLRTAPHMPVSPILSLMSVFFVVSVLRLFSADATWSMAAEPDEPGGRFARPLLALFEHSPSRFVGKLLAERRAEAGLGLPPVDLHFESSILRRADARGSGRQ